MTAVSADVVDELVEDVGVVNVQRISGGSAAATSVMVAQEMLGNCADVLQTNKDLVALVNRDATADGIAAAPVLGRGLGGGGSVPILLVDDGLPAAVNDYLAGTAEWRAGHGKVHQSIVAIGGTAVVSNSVMADAMAAAKTSSALTATITPLKYTLPSQIPAGSGKSVGDYNTQFKVTFSDDVTLATDTNNDGSISDAERRNTVEDPTMYRLNGRRIAASAATTPSDEPVSLLDLVFTADRTVTLTLSHHLEAGDTITVDNSLNEAANGRLGANNDRRKLERAELTLPGVTIAADRNAPVVEIVAVPTQSAFDILVTESSPLHNEINAENLSDFVSVVPHGRDATRKATGITVSVGTFDSLTIPDGVKPLGRATVDDRYRITTSVALERGDVVRIERKAFLDRGGRGSPLVLHAVPRVKTGTSTDILAANRTGNLEISSVSIGNVRHGNGTGAAGNDGDNAQADILTDLRVSAKATGVAAGAAGNDWRIFGYDDRATVGNAFNIDTAVDVANQRISYTISDALPLRVFRAPQIGDLAAELAGNSDFAANFSLSYVDATTDAKDDDLTATVPAGVPLIGGLSSVGVVVKFNAPIASLSNAGADLAEDIATRFPESGDRAADVDTIIVSFATPDNQVHISYQSDAVVALPARAGFRVIAAGVATSFADETDTGVTDAQSNFREILNSLRPDANIKP